MMAAKPRNTEGLWLKIGILLAIKVAGALFATIVFNRFSPLVDSKLYLSGYYTTDRFLRTQLINTLAVSLNHVGGPLFAHVTFGMISSAGIIYYYATGGRRWPLMLLLLLPSAFIWTSIVGKEAIYAGCFSMLLVIWSRYCVEKPNPTSVILALLSLGTCLILRPHYGLAIIWLFVATYIIKQLGDRSWSVLLTALALVVLSVYFFAWTDILYRGFGSIEASARASRYALFDIEPQTGFGFEHFKRMLPLGVITGIVGPLPSELMSRPEFLPFFLEGLFVLFAPLVIYRYAKRHDFADKQLFCRLYLWCIVPAVLALMILHAPFGLLNPGSATRWRTNFESLFYLAPLFLLFRFTDNKRNEDSSLSS
ncbi:hypothetical protein J8I26_09510 [Herbaspirillum sp. LeCh32-8]|uniref:hypothetical protein n=1 Tax=Herbaspirillum sp. LeCh32-8 TaxID=2821356 RepID=UPI001AEA3222|nr:hypothetical protein [Herbaspirillum sp. LeCh32-8]MBP0598340.1 hypothetical protein [Herbaspirillum sp. LeCh32-8]